MYRIMVVDDEDYILKALERVLSERPNWEVETYADATSALRRARTSIFDVVITDYRMPNMDGIEMLQQLQTLQPETVRILLTGVIDIETLMSAINQAGAFRFIPKPWEDEQLLKSIEEGLKFRDILMENKILAQTVRDQREALKNMGYEG